MPEWGKLDSKVFQQTACLLRKGMDMSKAEEIKQTGKKNKAVLACKAAAVVFLLFLM